MSRVFIGANPTSPDVVTVAASSSVNNLAAFTYAAWIYPTAYPDAMFAKYSAITSKDWDVSEIDMAFAAAGNGQLPGNHNLTGIGFGPDNVAKSAATDNSIVLNQWQRCVMTFDFNGDKKFHLYINGTEVTYQQQVALTGGPFDDSSGPITIGQLNGGAVGQGGFTGNIAQVQLWNVALTSIQVAADFAGSSVLPANVVDYLSFLTDQGSTEPDASGHGNVGVITAAAFSSNNPGSTPAPASSTTQSALLLVSNPSVDYIHLQDKNQMIVGWIDSTGAFGGTLGSDSLRLPTPSARITIVGDSVNDYLQFRNFTGALAWINAAGVFHKAGDGTFPTARAINTVFVQRCDEDLLALKNSIGSSVGWINAMGGFGGSL